MAKWGRIGAPKSAKRKAWLRKIAKRSHNPRRRAKRRTGRRKKR